MNTNCQTDLQADSLVDSPNNGYRMLCDFHYLFGENQALRLRPIIMVFCFDV